MTTVIGRVAMRAAAGVAWSGPAGAGAGVGFAGGSGAAARRMSMAAADVSEILQAELEGIREAGTCVAP